MYWVMPPSICFVSVSYAPIKEIDFISKMRKAAKYVSDDAKTSTISKRKKSMFLLLDSLSTS